MDTDVIIVGGRAAGSSLAAHLGRAGVRTCLLERARLPSYPAVSSPFLLPHAMELLDELGLSPSDYAPGCPPLREVVLAFGPYFEARFPLAERAGRSHFVVVDRQDFDTALWRSLARYDSLDCRDGFTVKRVLRDESGAAVGVEGVGRHGPATIRARAVIGADGRYSKVAREMGARVVHARTDVPTHVYYAFWEGVSPFEEGGPVAHIHSSMDGWSVVFMPMSRGRVSVVVQCQSALHEALEGDPSSIYEQALASRPAVWRRLSSARRVSKISGIKRMGNLFRQAGGPGWALVGDAWLQKDSIDAQGIYDTLAGSRILARHVSRWHRGEVDWPRTIAGYEREATRHLRPMFDATMGRVKREVYSIPPPFIARTALRWLLDDPEYKRRFGELLVRARRPSAFLTPRLVLGALARGAWRSMTRRPPALESPSPT